MGTQGGITQGKFFVRKVPWSSPCWGKSEAAAGFGRDWSKWQGAKLSVHDLKTNSAGVYGSPNYAGDCNRHGSDRWDVRYYDNSMTYSSQFIWRIYHGGKVCREWFQLRFHIIEWYCLNWLKNSSSVALPASSVDITAFIPCAQGVWKSSYECRQAVVYLSESFHQSHSTSSLLEKTTVFTQRIFTESVQCARQERQWVHTGEQDESTVQQKVSKKEMIV